MKKLLLLASISLKCFSTECNIANTTQMIDKLSKGEISTSFLDEIVEETEAIRINSALPNKGPRLSLDENLNESQSEISKVSTQKERIGTTEISGKRSNGSCFFQ